MVLRAYLSSPTEPSHSSLKVAALNIPILQMKKEENQSESNRPMVAEQIVIKWNPNIWLRSCPLLEKGKWPQKQVSPPGRH